MVLTEVAGGLATAGVGLSSLWSYNRDNFLYDRKMRQETELKVAEWRAEQAAQWREDVRDLTGLTEKKMQSYMMVNTLQLSMCVVLYTEGRLQPGTPHWLLHLYMLTLSGAFMYLLMSVWLAMHASVVVACEKARLLTQFVRLPIPTWAQFEKMRTSASAYERLGKRSMRMPFMDTVFEGQSGGSQPATSRSDQGDGKAEASPFCGTKGQMPMSAKGDPRIEEDGLKKGAPHGFEDTWGLERPGTEVHELAERPLHSNHHINLVRRSQTHYQCYDAFARISMTFGTNQLLLAVSYFVMGYVSVGDGAPWPAIMIVSVLVSIAIALVQLDISFTRQQHMQAFFLMTSGPVLATMSAIAWCMHERRWHLVPEILLPPAYLCHGLWLLWALKACQVQLLPGGEMLPTKFRLINYLDVFGWIKNQQTHAKQQQTDAKMQRQGPSKTDGDYKAMVQDGQNVYSPIGAPAQAQARSDSKFGWPDRPDSPLTCTVLSEECTKRNIRERTRLVNEIRLTLESWQSADTLQIVDEYTKKRVDRLDCRLRELGERGPTTSPGMAVESERAAALRKVGEALENLPNLLSPPRENENMHEMDMVISASHAIGRQLSQETLGWDRQDSMDLSPREISCGSHDTGLLQRPGSPTMANGEPWVKAYHCTDFGTEVPYEYHKVTGQVRHTHVTSSRMSPPTSPQMAFSLELPSMGRELSRETAGGHPAEGEGRLRSLSAAEEEMDALEKLKVVSKKVEVLEAEPDDVPIEPRHENGYEGEGRRTPLARALGIVKRSKQRAAHQAAEVAPWLFADMEEMPDASEKLRSAKKYDCACPEEIIITKRGHSKPAPDAGDEINNEEIVKALGPDKLPWEVFRYATLMLVLLWMVSPILLYGWYPYGRSEFGPESPLHLGSREKGSEKFANMEDPDGTFSGMVLDNRDMDYDLEPTISDYESMPILPQGQQLKVHWPFESQFTPRALTTDHTGKHIVVSEDFGVYFGRVEDGGSISVEDTSFGPSYGDTSPELKLRRLRGKADADTDSASSPRSSFMHMPRCTALEGKQLNDVGVVCSKDIRPLCRVLVLHSNGRRLTECPLYMSPESQNASGADDFGALVRPLSDWKIAGSWLDHDSESVESLAVDSECDALQSRASPDQQSFDPAEVGCVVVGTSSGRVVQLRRHVSKEHYLVPEWAMQERRGKVAQGSLQVFPGGFVLMLRSEIGVMQAINAEKGTILGQWRLPDNADWFSISGGGASLFMMGHEKNGGVIKDDKHVTLWKFPVPPELEKLFAAYPSMDSLGAADS